MTHTIVRLAPRSRRLLGVLIDSTLGLIAAAAIVIASGMDTEMSSLENISSTNQVAYRATAFIFVSVIFLLMHGYLLAKRGQTIGKYFTKTRIVDLAGNIPSLQRTFLRRYFVLGAIMQIPFISIIGILDPLFIFKKNRRCLHDYIAETQVIEATGMYAIITNNALRIIGAAAVSVSILIALWARAHSPNMGFDELMIKLDSYILKQPIYYVIMLVAALIAVGGAVSIILSFNTVTPTLLDLPSPNIQLEDLTKAKQLYDSGAIDATEYQKIKNAILNK